MHAVEFLKERESMCKVIGCNNCWLSIQNNRKGVLCDIFCSKFPEKAVEVVEKFSNGKKEEK